MNEGSLREIEQQSYRETMQDGFTEIFMGLIFLVLPVLLVEPGFVAIFVVFYIIFMPQCVEAVKKKYVYPRVGYVKPREDQPPKLSLGVAVVVLLIFISVITVFYMLSIGTIDRFFIYKWLPTVFGFIMWGPSLYLKDKTGQIRYYLLGASTSLTGVAVSLSPSIPAEMSMAVFMVGWGLVFLVLGTVRFTLFIRKYPVIDTPEDDAGEQ